MNERNDTCGAFTLVEIMISVVIIGAMMTMAMSGGVDLYKKYTMERGYRNIHADARRSIALINRDIRYTSTITNAPSAFSSSNICLYVVRTNQMTATATSVNSVIQYRLLQVQSGDRVNNMLIRREWWGNSAGVVNTTTSPNSSMNLTLSNHSVGVSHPFFTIYKKPGQSATSDYANAAEVRAYLEITNVVLANITTDRIQVRVQMRNK